MNRKFRLRTIDGFKIFSVHTVAQEKSIVLWLHGITVDMNEYLDFFKDGAQYLVSKGVDSLRIDFRGHGKSSGKPNDFTIVGQMLDIQCALGYLEEKYDLRKTGLHIVGCSFGAPPAIFAAIRYPQLVRSIVLIAPVLSYWRTFLEPETDWGKSIFNDQSFASLEQTNRLIINDSFSVGVQLIEEMRLIHPDVVIMQVKQDVTIIHGDADTMVPYSVSEQVAAVRRSIRFISMPGMDHGFMDSNDESGTSPKSLENKKRIYETIAARIS